MIVLLDLVLKQDTENSANKTSPAIIQLISSANNSASRTIYLRTLVERKNAWNKHRKQNCDKPQVSAVHFLEQETYFPVTEAKFSQKKRRVSMGK